MADLPMGSVIRTVREWRGLSQRQLAQRMGVPRTYISKAEHGRVMPQLATLLLLADGLGIEAWRLLRRAERMKDALEQPELAAAEESGA